MQSLTTPRRRAAQAVALACIAVIAACGNEEAGDAVSPESSYAIFEAQVYPLLLRDCGFSECHGKEERFYQLWGPGRTRLRETTMSDDPVTKEEIRRSYERTRAMLATSADVSDSLLLRKPLEPNAGGQGHKGVDEFGRNVYRYKEDPSFVTLSSWARSAAVDQPSAVSGGAAGVGAAGMGVAP
jgi:hypothetical protein